mgnify:CR=1 FL=1
MVMASRWVVVEWTRGSGPRFGERMGMGRGGRQRAPHGGTVNVWMMADSPSYCVLCRCSCASLGPREGSEEGELGRCVKLQLPEARLDGSRGDLHAGRRLGRTDRFAKESKCAGACLSRDQ